MDEDATSSHRRTRQRLTSSSFCADERCLACFSKSFASFNGLTSQGLLKRDCWIVDDNGGFHPRQVSAIESRKKYFFNCDTPGCGHVFSTTLYSVVQLGTWCPFCSKPAKQLCDDESCTACHTKSFAGYEECTQQGILKRDCWLIDRNNNLYPRQIFSCSHRKYWFRCHTPGCGHDFNTELSSIVNGRWCPYCSNQRLCEDQDCMVCHAKSFAGYGGLTLQRTFKRDCWDVEANPGLLPRQVFAQSTRSFWFRCDVPSCNHSFSSRLGNIVANNRWCPFCSNSRLCTGKDCGICHAKSFAGYVELTSRGALKKDCWDIKKNRGVLPREVFMQSNDSYSFCCDNPECNHVFTASLGDITRGRWCPFCSNKQLCSKADCIACHDKSFAAYGGRTLQGKFKRDRWIIKENQGRLPREVFSQCNQQFTFLCDAPHCLHLFSSSLDAIVGKGCWCPFCSSPPKQLCNDENCLTCHAKSFATFEELTCRGILKRDCWDVPRNNGMNPRQVFKGSHTKYSFQCDAPECGHAFTSGLCSVSNGSWCPFCSTPPKQLCNDEDCLTCHAKSFAAFEKLTCRGVLKRDCWDVPLNNDIGPRQVFKWSHMKYSFRCDAPGCNHVFTSRLYSVTGGSWCPYCASSKGNVAVLQSLRELLAESLDVGACEIRSEATFPDCVGPGGRCMPFDVAVLFADGRLFLIEFDGVQHFEVVKHFHRRAEDMPQQRVRDMLKTKFAIHYGATLLRIAYTDLDSTETWVRVGLEAVTQGEPAVSAAQGRVIFSDPHIYARQPDWARTCPSRKLRWAEATIKRYLGQG